MAMTVVVSGKIYNGKVYDWEDKKNNNEERELFRGRLNYRDRSTGQWEFIDVVCWKDFGDKGGLVAWLDNHFAQDAESAPTDKGGQPIEIVGYMRPTTKKANLVGETASGKKGKVDVFHPTYELVIESADFPPAFEKYKGGAERVDEDFDFEDDELEDDNDPEDIDEDEEEDFEDEPEPEPTPAEKRRQQRRASSTSGSTGRTGRKSRESAKEKEDKKAPKKTGSTRRKKQQEVDPEEDPFFDK